MVGALTNARARLNAGLTGQLLNITLAVIVAIVLVNAVGRIFQGGTDKFFLILGYGIANGSIYALIALGYTMVYGIIELINFAHADIFTMGAFVSLAMLQALGLNDARQGDPLVIFPLILVFIATMLLMGGLNIVIERVAYRPLRRAPRLAPLITAVGVSFILEGLMFLWKGPYNLHYPTLLPTTKLFTSGPLAAVGLGVNDLFVIVIAIILVIALSLFVSRSKLGKAMRATAQDRDAAQLMGIDINRTIAATFFIGASLAGAGGIIFGLYFHNVTFDLGFSAGLVAFTAAVFGGIGNIEGAALGALIIGLIQSYSDAYFETKWTQVVIFAILILVLVFRPTGLLGMRVPEK